MPIFTYYTFFDVGGKSEVKGNTGATHFLEHMMFKGAKKYGPGDFNSFIDSFGGDSNAYTNFDSTVYYESLPIDALEKIIDIEADRMTSILLEKDSFLKEKDVVLEERKYRYENVPSGKLYLKMMQAVFEGTPYGGSVIGEKEDVQSLTPEVLEDFFLTYYRPNNAVIVVAGDVYASKVYEMIEAKYGSISFNKEIENLKKMNENPERFAHRARYRRVIELNSSNPLPLFMMAYKGKKSSVREAFVMDILAAILGLGESSYLVQHFVKAKKPILSQVYLQNYTLKHNGVFFLGGELLEGVNLKKFRKDLLKKTKTFCSEEVINERSLQKTKNQFIISYLGELDTNKGVAHFIGLRENFYGDYSFYKKELDHYESISVEEVKNVCHKTFDGQEQIFLSIWNKHKK